MEPENAFYNVPLALRLRGRLNVEALQQSLGEIVKRHESLRSVFPNREGDAVQKVLPPSEVPLPLPLVDLTGCPQEKRAAEERRNRIGG